MAVQFNSIHGVARIVSDLKTDVYGTRVRHTFRIVQNGGRDDKKTADFFNVSVWKTTDQDLSATMKASLLKGKEIVYEGSLQNRQYNDAQGKPTSFMEIVLNRIVPFVYEQAEGAAEASSSVARGVAAQNVVPQGGLDDDFFGTN